MKTILTSLAVTAAAVAVAACYPPERDETADSGATPVTTATTAQAQADAAAATAQAQSDAAASSTPAAATAGARTIEGRVTGFETGDYNHVRVDTGEGEPQSFFIGGGEAVGPFLVAHRTQPLTLTVEQRREMSEFAGGEIDMTLVTDARNGTETAAEWWARETRDPAARARIEAATTAAMASQP